MMYYYYPHPFGFFGGLFEVIFWIAVILIIVKIFRRCKKGDCHLSLTKSALDILKERYAKGEIDKAEFETKKKDLS